MTTSKYLLVSAIVFLVLPQVGLCKPAEQTEEEENLAQSLLKKVRDTRRVALHQRSVYVERIAAGEIPGMRLALPEGAGACHTHAHCRVMKVEEVEGEEGEPETRERALSEMEVAVGAGISPSAVMLNEFGAGLIAAQGEMNALMNGAPNLEQLLGAGYSLPGFTHEDTLARLLPTIFAAGGQMMIETAWAIQKAELSLRAGASQAQAEANRENELTSQVETSGNESIAGLRTAHLRVSNLNQPMGQVEGQEAYLNGASIWIDTEKYVIVKHRVEVTAVASGASRQLFIERVNSDYRTPPGCGEMYEPYRRVMRIGGIFDAEQKARMEEARQQLEEFELQMASLPAQQREMMEKRMGGQMRAVRGLASGGVIEHVEEIEEILCDPDLAKLFSVFGGEVPEDMLRQIQLNLQALGYEPGNTEGVLDTLTRIAISQFQAEYGLQVTGEPSLHLAGVLAQEVQQQGVA